jgi:hypothetical protein
MFEASFHKLCNYLDNNGFKGYDPYDALNSCINFKLLGNFGSKAIIQIQKRNPINIRKVIGIKQGYNPKGIGLFLKAYSLLYQKTNNKIYLARAKWLYNWLKNNYTSGYSGKAWGYNFDWASNDAFIPAFTPSVVVTSFVIDGIFEYFKVTKDIQARDLILSASKYIMFDIPVTKYYEGITYSYTHLLKDSCYNASLHATEILAKSDFLSDTKMHLNNINKAIDFVLSKQHKNGEWWYSLNNVENIERQQIDFHQGFVLISLSNLNSMLPEPRKDVQQSIERGLSYYKNNQFYANGRSLWRIPKVWPTEIHNQSQGIITFSKLKDYDLSYFPFAHTIMEWTINNMQDKRGYFYYRKYPLFTNKIPYIRWSQAWMLLAFAELLSSINE